MTQISQSEARVLFERSEDSDEFSRKVQVMQYFLEDARSYLTTSFYDPKSKKIISRDQKVAELKQILDGVKSSGKITDYQVDRFFNFDHTGPINRKDFFVLYEDGRKTNEYNGIKNKWIAPVYQEFYWRAPYLFGDANDMTQSLKKAFPVYHNYYEFKDDFAGAPEKKRAQEWSLDLLELAAYGVNNESLEARINALFVVSQRLHSFLTQKAHEPDVYDLFLDAMSFLENVVSGSVYPVENRVQGFLVLYKMHNQGASCWKGLFPDIEDTYVYAAEQLIGSPRLDSLTRLEIIQKYFIKAEQRAEKEAWIVQTLNNELEQAHEGKTNYGEAPRFMNLLQTSNLKKYVITSALGALDEKTYPGLYIEFHILFALDPTLSLGDRQLSIKFLLQHDLDDDVQIILEKLLEENQGVADAVTVQQLAAQLYALNSDHPLAKKLVLDNGPNLDHIQYLLCDGLEEEAFQAYQSAIEKNTYVYGTDFEQGAVTAFYPRDVAQKFYEDFGEEAAPSIRDWVMQKSGESDPFSSETTQFLRDLGFEQEANEYEETQKQVKSQSRYFFDDDYY